MNTSVIWRRVLHISACAEKIDQDGNFLFNKSSHLTSSSSSAQHYLSQQVSQVSTVSTSVIVTLFGILFVSFVINFLVLRSVISLPKRPATILVAHLSSIAILFAFLCVALVSEYIKWVDLTGHGMCEFMNFLKSTIIGIFSLNIVAIIYERFRVFNCFNHGKLLMCRVIMLVWITAIFANIPTAFMVVFKEDDITISSNENEQKAGIPRGICKPVLLFGMFGATVVYEFLRFFLFHVSVACYMVYAMYKIRSNLAQLNLLKPIPSDPTKKKVKNIRFIYVHFIIFILIWLHVGALIFTYRVRKTKHHSSTRNLLIGAITGLLVFLYLVLNPLIYLCLDVGCCFCLRRKDKSVLPGLQQDMQEGNEWNPCTSAIWTGEGTNVKVNACTSGNNAGGNEMEMVRIQSGESGRESKIKSRSELKKVVQIADKKHRSKYSRQREELHSVDMSRISTFMASSSS